MQRHALGIFAGALVALDGLVIVMSRIAMLDIIAAAHISLAITLVADRRRIQADTSRFGSLYPSIISRYSNQLAAVLLGAAVATKWSAVPALVATGAITIIRSVRSPTLTSRRRCLSSGVATFVLIPAIVYVAAHGAWIANYEETQTGRERCSSEPCDSGIEEISRGFVLEQTSKVRFQDALVISHPDRSSALSWPVLARPVLSYFEACGTDSSCADQPGKTKRVVGIGNIVVWVVSLVSVGAIFAGLIRRRWWASIDPIAMVIAQWLPWVFAPNPGFLFYMTPVVPFMAMATGIAALSIRSSKVQRRTALVVVASACATCVVYYPLWTALPLSPTQVDLRLPVDSWR